MLRLLKIDQGLIKEIPTAAGELENNIDSALWIDIADPDDSERALLESILRTDLPESEEVSEIETSSRCFVDQSGIHVHSLFLLQTEGRLSTVSVACILQTNRLITVRETELADFRLFRMRARIGQVECHSPSQLLVTLLDQKIENHADSIEDIHHQLEKLSFEVLENDDADLEEVISKLARLEDNNGKIRLCLMDTQRDISFLLRHLRHLTEECETLREIMRDVDTLMSHTAFLFDKINFLMDSTQGFINIEQNQIIKIFSIAAVVFLPPTLVASIYGMNFKFMPELGWWFGYPTAIVLMVLAGVAPFWYFKRKGWL
ncbi:MAG: magnesium/cobalt transporter CorA [Gammaproteobacteria bacterium]|nr:MAG: magnesium/cobalt transporter CorA [Gammaproteobacteria bacterium]